uniref:Helicase-associated domain-containing protein n=1 Tax=Streptomyces avermitilis TaxID=33903 RepID=A0A499VP88_STRAX|nr:hypothetical protein SAVMC3_89720 [Streptomyces avermitilis]
MGEDDEMVPIGQHTANLRRKGGLGKDPERAAERAQQLTAIDPDWNCPGRSTGNATTASSPTWSKPTATCRDRPGVLMDGDDIGRWLERQSQPGAWAQLSTEQQERLSQLGVKPIQAPSPARQPRVRRRARARRSKRSSGPGGPRTVGGAGRRPPACTARPR